MLSHGNIWFLTRNLCRVRLVHTIRTLKEDPRWPGWELVVGIEVHAQIKSRAKLFSETFTADLDELPNSHVSPFDAAFPGTLPRLNSKCVELGVRTAIALNAEVQRRSAFDRKHYFYADLPSGYQITQQYAPIARGGGLKLGRDDVFVRIKQVQLEQENLPSYPETICQLLTSIGLGPGLWRLFQNLICGPFLLPAESLLTRVNFPYGLSSPEEAADYVRTLQALLRCVGSSDGHMEQGSLRCDVNVSVNRGGSPPGTRCEIKNLNSVKFMMIAITCEAHRQIELLESGRSVPQETRGFDEDRAETYALRSKEDAPDYRYMPDPNLPPLLLDQPHIVTTGGGVRASFGGVMYRRWGPTRVTISSGGYRAFSEEYITKIRNDMPELPDMTRARLLALGLSRRDTDVLMDVDSGREVGFDGELGGGAVAYFDSVARGRDPKAVVNWITHELLGQLAFRRETFKENPISVEQMGNLIDLVQTGTITGTSGKTILRHLLSHHSQDMPSKLAEQLSLIAVRDDGSSLEKWCSEAISALPEEAKIVRTGNVRVVNKIVGRVMKASRGRANAEDVRAMLLKMLQ